jgi:hypothetical protein
MKNKTAMLIPIMALLLPAVAVAQDDAEKVARGEFLATVGLCNDCHTPLAMGPEGPAPDMTRMLSGHPQDVPLTITPIPEPWLALISSTLTAFAGPWGISYAANLTPDPDTGILRDFTEEQFVATMRTGRHQGQGREILPPMPWQYIGKMSDEDLSALWTYLRQIPAVNNKVPEPTPPAN